MKSKSRKPTKAELDFMFAVKHLPCVDCGAPAPSEFDHWVIGYRLGHFYGNPRCVSCHRGNKKQPKPVKREAMLYKQTCKAVGYPFILPPMKQFRYWENVLGDDYENFIA